MDSDLFDNNKLAVSPEGLDKYIHVTTPGMWLILSTVIVFLAGIIIWGVTGRLDTVVKAAAVVTDGRAYCYVRAEDVDNMERGMSVTINDEKYKILSIDKNPTVISKDEDIYLMYVGDFKDGEWVYRLDVGMTGQADGIYQADIVTESVSPVSFIIN